ncbi:hypothetical protein PVAND_017698 [Polypedilum vanderplanki]|uniref:Uncharacterized protein n=1 Tax=Polypedilum vanderplanki TaxID=319348 RepID=A0A9J6B998_POLVA|nr:hypothetical protein PVAND_017698 [Polypedilum vanderplanki]
MGEKGFGKEDSFTISKTIIFTPEEVYLHTFHENNTFKFVPVTKKITGKKSYNMLLIEKLKSVSNPNNVFRIHEPFRSSGKANKVCYILCEHNEKMAITYKKADLRLDSELKLIWRATCGACFPDISEKLTNPRIKSSRLDRSAKTQNQFVEYEEQPKQLIIDTPQFDISNYIHFSSTSFPMGSIDDLSFREIIIKVHNDIKETLKVFFIECGRSDNPVRAAITHRAELGLQVNASILNSLNIRNIQKFANEKASFTQTAEYESQISPTQNEDIADESNYATNATHLKECHNNSIINENNKAIEIEIKKNVDLEEKIIENTEIVQVQDPVIDAKLNDKEENSDINMIPTPRSDISVAELEAIKAAKESNNPTSQRPKRKAARALFLSPMAELARKKQKQALEK